MPQRHDGVLNLHTSGGSRPSDKGGGDPDPEIRGWGAASKKIFRPFMPHFRLKIRGGPGYPGPSPGSATAYLANW